MEKTRLLKSFEHILHSAKKSNANAAADRKRKLLRIERHAVCNDPIASYIQRAAVSVKVGFH